MNLKQGDKNSLNILRKLFLKRFPKGFYDNDYLTVRDYKWEAHLMMAEILSKKELQTLLRSKNYEEICKRAKKVLNKTDIVFLYDKISLSNGLKVRRNEELFAAALNDILYSDKEEEGKFNALRNVLAEVGVPKWPLATYFQFIRFPKEHMFLKPMDTKHFAAGCDFDFNYKPELNWFTYKKLLEFAYWIMKNLEDLKPRDMIDIQSFLVCE